MWCRFYYGIDQYEKKNRPSDEELEYDVYVDKWMRDQEEAKKLEKTKSKMEHSKRKGIKLGR